MFGLLLILGGLLFILPGSVVAQEPADDVSAQAAVGTAITYQGRLTDSSGPVNDTCDFRFRLYDAVSGGTLLGTDNANSVSVSDGYFSVVLNNHPCPVILDILKELVSRVEDTDPFNEMIIVYRPHKIFVHGNEVSIVRDVVEYSNSRGLYYFQPVLFYGADELYQEQSPGIAFIGAYPEFVGQLGLAENTIEFIRADGYHRAVFHFINVVFQTVF